MGFNSAFKGLIDGPFVPQINVWEPCCFTKVPDGPQTYTLDVLWLQEEGAQILRCLSEAKASHSQTVWAEVYPRDSMSVT